MLKMSTSTSIGQYWNIDELRDQPPASKWLVLVEKHNPSLDWMKTVCVHCLPVLAIPWSISALHLVARWQFSDQIGKVTNIVVEWDSQRIEEACLAPILRRWYWGGLKFHVSLFSKHSFLRNMATFHNGKVGCRKYEKRSYKWWTLVLSGPVGGEVGGLQRFKRLEKETNLLFLCINQPTPEWNISETEI